MRARLVRWLPTVVVCLVAWVIGGLLGLVVALVSVAYVGLGLPARRLVLASLVTLAVTPFVWLVANRHDLGTVSFALVSAHPVPGQLGLVTVVLLLTGVFLDGPDRNEGDHA